MKNKALISATVVLSIAVCVLYVRLQNVSNRLSRTDEVAERVRTASDTAVRKIETAADSARAEIEGNWRSKLQTEAEQIATQYSGQFEKRLKEVKASIAEEQARLAELQERREREQNGLPEQVEIDDLNSYYAAKWENKSNSFAPIETFNTSQGEISFMKSDFSFAYVPSSGKLAWLQIGKEDSNLNSSLIKTWLEESAQSKIQQGYSLVYNRTRPADYGEYTEKMYRKGDMYFKTYYQYQRVQGTYDRYSLQYTFYVEVGSESRKEQYQIEQYNSKIGS